MKEIGGYIELETYHLPMLHENAVHLNCGRNCLAYLIKTKEIKKIRLPYFLCCTVKNICEKYGVKIRYYHIQENFEPENIKLDEGEWIYLVNYYGQISNQQMMKLKEKYKNVIVDNAQAYFQMPVKNIDTLYTCRKYFGVPDGAILYTNRLSQEELLQDESFQRMNFLLGRYERTASEFYSEYVDNNKQFGDEPIKIMSRLTYNLLHAIDYDTVQKRREDNFIYLNTKFKGVNRLLLIIPKGPFMYPLYIENGEFIRKKLQKIKIYIPILWPDVFQLCDNKDLEYDLAKNILPLPVDQRYGRQDMEYIWREVIKWLS